MSVIKVENLSKKYLIRHEHRERYTALRDVLANKAKGMFNRGIVQPWKRLTSNSTVQQFNNSTEEFFALKDVSFEIKQGERVGIIGRNGAGKTTLLKLLSRITEPTSGRIEITGRVASLLEVGTGFHPELTGRENIFLNGAILGMSKTEIKKKFDEIVDFAEIDKFLDTPVKRYSSGMYVRLAFAVAAHLEPEILIVDEVLAVGDAQFQKKCLGKMEEVGKEGRTVLFVSHNMGAITALCKRVLWLTDGAIKKDGQPGTVVSNYLEYMLQDNSSLQKYKSIDGSIEIERIITKNVHDQVTSTFRTGEPLTVEIHYYAKIPILRPYFWLAIVSQFGSLFASNMLLDNVRPEKLEGRGCLSCTFDMLPLMPQQNYSIDMGIREANGTAALMPSTTVAYFSIEGNAEDIGLTGELADNLIGLVSPVIVKYSWRLPNGKLISVNPLKERERQ